MIAKDGDGSVSSKPVSMNEMCETMERAVQDAKERTRKMGVPIPLDPVDGVVRYELPDGTIVAEDPWHGEKNAPEGWYERFGIQPPK